MKALLSVTQLAVAAVSLSGCAVEVDSAEPVGEEQDDLYLNGTTWPSGTVNVCWDGSDGNLLSGITETKRLVEATWGRAAKITFPGWAQCNLAASTTGNYSTIALHFCTGLSTSANCPATNYDNGTRAAGAFRGQSLQGRAPFTAGPGAGKFTPGVTNVSLIGDDPDPFQTRFRYQVIHEFGHALGYQHEQDRPDNFNAANNPIFCALQTNKATSGANQTSFFDTNSIMNYCATDPLTGSIFLTMLSGGDILGVRVAYGRNTAAHGFMIKSDRNSGLAVNAWGGAAEGTTLRLHNACTLSNPDCTWTYQRGMLVSDKDPTLAINASGGAVEGATLKLTRACTPSNPDCTWTYKGGQFMSDRNTSLRINAWSGAAHGATLVVTSLCTASNPDCTWTMPDVMLSSNRNTSLSINAVNGASNGGVLAMHNACAASNGDCTFTFSKGMLVSTKNTTLALNAINGAADGTMPVLSNTCAFTNKDCTWTWKKGQIISDNTTNGTLPLNAVGGAVHFASMKLAKACRETNPDCVFSGLFAK